MRFLLSSEEHIPMTANHSILNSLQIKVIVEPNFIYNLHSAITECLHNFDLVPLWQNGKLQPERKYKLRTDSVMHNITHTSGNTFHS